MCNYIIMYENSKANQLTYFFEWKMRLGQVLTYCNYIN